MRLRTNESRLVRLALQGSIIPPLAWGWEVPRDGHPYMLPTVGGITSNVRLGDSVFGFESDHIEPGVSCIAGGFNDRRTANPNLSFTTFSCVGNTATVISGKLKGKKGVVTGHHGGVEHVLIDFDARTVRDLTYDDKIMIDGFGQGLKLLDYPDVAVTGLDPRLLEKMGLKAGSKGMLKVPVAAVVQAELMGSGLGHSDSFKGDYDIQITGPEVIAKYRLEKLRFGDLVAIIDHQSTFGWSFKKGAVSIAVVVHGDSKLAGHGPGVQTILTSPSGKLDPLPDTKANIGAYLKLGRWRRG